MDMEYHDADTARAIFEQFQYMVTLMYTALQNAYPIIEKQLHLIMSIRLMSNIVLFICFLTVIFVLYKTHMEIQDVRKFWNVKIKKRWLGLIIGVFCIGLLTVNLYPGFMLMELDAQIYGTTERAALESQQRLFQDGVTE